MALAELTPASLMVSLEQLASAQTEKECAAALVSAAALVQEAVLNGQSPESFHAAMGACPEGLAPQLGAVMDRSVNFHLLESGGTLGLWMLPVVISTDKNLPAELPLETNTLAAVKMSGALLQQLDLTAAKIGERTGWTYVLPSLYSEEQIRECDIGELIRLPHAARDVVRGERKNVEFNIADTVDGVGPGANLFFMPFIAFAPEGHPPVMPMASQRTVTRMTKWVTDSLTPALGKDFAVHVAPQPQPFSLALRVGERLRMDVRLREIMIRVTHDSGVEPNGLAALVAPYVTRQSDGTFMVGVTLVSRMTKNVVGTLSLPVETSDGEEEVALATHILRDLGMECVQDYHHPVQTLACQHCGNFQFALPSPDVAFKGVSQANTKHMH
ncbi:hypothetical protein KTD31_03485 [Burkholderia multivorans]|uniref:hypothetical protein n=1 Tax=Burkholderia multivorans TaxID=87883 RepID=UPI001C23441E|nr:hypothetical protein [Burkholderia multivorans]MBU9200416.1 hypothetical protein [Burkholderia multivorans]MDN8078459.1 hypothetical protein [Burkholderia multivorans]